MRDIVNHLIVQNETVHHVDYKATESSISFSQSKQLSENVIT